MSYLKTVVTYHIPAEAEVDKAFLESRGLTVCLLNANTSRNELGAPFYVQLQVVEEEYEGAAALLREHNPARFGSAARVADIERELKATGLWFLLSAGIAAIGAYLLIPPPTPLSRAELLNRLDGPPPDFRLIGAVILGLGAGVIAATFRMRKRV